MTQAISAYREVVVSPEFRELERLRVDARHNEASALLNAERKAEKAKALSIARNMLKRNRPIDGIAEDTGLSRAEIERLRNTN